jgi:hypothetical protein
VPLNKPRAGGSAHPAGLAAHSADAVWVTSTRGNNVQLVNAAGGKVEQVVGVGVAPYGVCCPRAGLCYVCVPEKTRLDEMNPPLKELKGKALGWARKSLELNLDEADEADEDTFNRILWHATRGDAVPYPERFAGPRQPRSEP